MHNVLKADVSYHDVEQERQVVKVVTADPVAQRRPQRFSGCPGADVSFMLS
jgi:hypothetical protein